MIILDDIGELKYLTGRAKTFRQQSQKHFIN